MSLLREDNYPTADALLPADIASRDRDNQTWLDSKPATEYELIMKQINDVAAGLVVRRTIQDPQWVEKRNCSDKLDTFTGENGKGRGIARKLCMECVVWYECFEAGINESTGIWGGTTESEREEVRRIRKARLERESGKN